MNSRTVDNVWAESMSFGQSNEFIELEIDESKLEEYNTNATNQRQKLHKSISYKNNMGVGI